MQAAKLNADTPDPVTIALRSQMKGEFLAAFAHADTSHFIPWQNADLVVYGSTLMRQLAYHENVIFPLEGIKSSDIDIGVIEHGQRSDADAFRNQLMKHVVPVVRHALSKSGFGYLQETNNFGHLTVLRASSAEEIDRIPSSSLITDFYVTRSFTPEEMHARLKSRSDYEQLKAWIPSESLEVRLVLGINDKPFPVLMDPLETKANHGSGTFKRTRALDMLAGKIVRSMTDKYKPTDLIDIYNLVKGTQADRPFINLDPISPDNDIDALRTLIVAYLPMSRGVQPERKDLLAAFEHSSANIQKFLKRVEPAIAANKIPLLREKADDIFAIINQMLQLVMGPKAKDSIGPLHLTQNEKAFIDLIDGYISEPKPSQPSRGFLGRLTSNGVSENGSTLTVTEPRIDVELLKQDHPHGFAKYPQLEKNILGSAILNDKLGESRHRLTIKRAPDDIALDF